MKAEQEIRWMRYLIWSYFFLWIFEGALRKWVLPFLANPLLIVRDPVVLAIYALAWRRGLFPRNSFILLGALLATASFVVGLLASNGAILVVVYGLHANFLHLPLIFIIPRIFGAHDVYRVGYWLLLLATPMALLMILQFKAPPLSWINAGSDENFQQIGSALGRIRAPGTFSFISGPICFYSAVTAFLLYSQFAPQRYSPGLVVTAGLSTAAAAVVSGSRSLVAAIFVVFLIGLLSGMVLQPRLVFRWLGCLLIFAFIVYFVHDLPVFQESTAVFTARISNASGSEGGMGGFFSRISGDFVGAWPLLFSSPLLGYGLGMGTNVGAVMMTGRAQFLLAEGEWERVLLESGPLLGSLFLLLRILLAAWLGSMAWQHMARRDPLSFLLFSTLFTTLIDGNFGQPTTLGFVALMGGFCLAAKRIPQHAARRKAKRPRFSVANRSARSEPAPA